MRISKVAEAHKQSLDAGFREDDVAQLADLFRLMGDASRLRIILSCLQEPTSVGDVADRLDLSPSLVSHHLRLLRGARVMRADRQGKRVYYSAADDHIATMVENMMLHVREPSDVEVEPS